MSPRRVRFSLRRLFVVNALLALGLAILRHVLASWGPAEIVTATLAIFLATNVLAWFQTHRWRTFWAGFGLGGWIYLALALGSPLAEMLPTTTFLEGLHDRLHGNDPVSAVDDFDDGAIFIGAHAESFKRAGQCILSLFCALFGGIAALVLFPSKMVAEDPPSRFPPDGSLLDRCWRDQSVRNP